MAALAVAYSHLVWVYWLLRDAVAAATFSAPQTGPLPALLPALNTPWFNGGPFGVGVFFLISGLVIPISLATHTRGSFLLARALRIYPTYLVVLLIEWAVLHADAAYWGRPFGYGLRTLFNNALLLHTVVGEPSIDLVNWTLCVEVKFYLLAALLAPRLLRAEVAPLFLIAGGVLAFNLALVHGVFGTAGLAYPDLGYTAAVESLFLLFLLIGVLFNYHLRGRLGTRGLVLGVAAMAVLFVATWRVGLIRDQVPVVTLNYGYALALFAGLYALRRRVRANPLLDALAAISFPFYLLHSLVGFSLLKLLLVRGGTGYPVALLATLVVTIGLAVLVHRYVERPCIGLGRGLARPARPRVEASSAALTGPPVGDRVTTQGATGSGP